jgi:putative hemolysin
MEQLLEGRPLDLVALAEPPLFVPETMTLMKLLEQLRRTHLPVALVVDEFGEVEGLVSITWCRPLSATFRPSQAKSR